MHNYISVTTRVPVYVYKSGGKSKDRKKRRKYYMKTTNMIIHLQGKKERWGSTMPDISIFTGRHEAVVCGVTEKGRMWLLNNISYGSRDTINHVHISMEYLTEFIEQLEDAGLEVQQGR